MIRTALLLTGWLAGPALAHSGHDHAAGAEWTLDWWVLALLGLSAGLYALGAVRLWRRARRGRRQLLLQALAFAAGWLGLFASLVSPLHDLGQMLFSAHMVEHEILMVWSAPLLVLAKPIGCMLWAFPEPARTGIGGALNFNFVRSAWRLITGAFVATLLHGLAIWIWHAPALFSAALRSEAVHWAQHLSFFLTALLFWWAVLQVGRRAHGYGGAIFALFVTVLHSGFLGVLITFAREPLYPGQGAAAAAWGMTALEDQQVAGLVMWVPGSIAYVVAALVLVGLWIGTSGAAAYRESDDAVALR